MAITNKIGVPVTGEDFFGRKRELINAHRYLDSRQSLLLSAPRRIGKSSLAKKLLYDKAEDGWKCVYIDLQGIATKDEFLRKLIESFSGVGLFERAGSKAKDLIDVVFNKVKGITFGELKIDLNSFDQTQALLNRLSDMFDHEHDTLIVIDELTLFLGKLMDSEGRNRDEVEFLLNWFRSIRQHENSGIRWIFCGSVGLRNFTNHYSMSQTINDLIEFPLGELPQSEAKGLIAALAESYGLSIDDDLTVEIIERLQWPIPYFIQLLVDRLIFKGITRVGTDDVKDSICELSRSDYFMTWTERLNEYRELEGIARGILNGLSASESGLNKEQLLTVAMNGVDVAEVGNVQTKLIKVLEMLEHDGYIMRNLEYRKFRSPLLREWWKYKFID
ncbi:MAG: ATP-binding protein [Bacteroides sp.]|nr:ATP-binding protein [Bacteroides sp.]